MSSAFINSSEIVNVSNMMFWRVCEFALELGKQKINPPEGAIEKFNSIKEKFGPTPHINIEETFSSEELKFWSEILLELSDKIYKREIGNQENQEWQVWTIWATCSISRLFDYSFHQP